MAGDDVDMEITFTVRRGSFLVSRATLADPDALGYAIGTNTPEGERATLTSRPAANGGALFTWRIITTHRRPPGATLSWPARA